MRKTEIEILLDGYTPMDPPTLVDKIIAVVVQQEKEIKVLTEENNSLWAKVDL